ncbi:MULTISPECIES: DUF6266 family protein [unclassified Sphingobacterium]|uniref:DUF6266 family protein n=1 Tax=unclassified Sphingobacterium TaxID=2609468 RepID=UPI0025F0EE69|nr:MULTISPECIES: DUF6266 family protein [unclassified Sphingobacterium]
MAIIKNGANGTLSGKAGSVVFVTNGNTTYARGLPKKTSKKPTSEQVVARSRFSIIQKFMSPILPFIRIGFKNYNPSKKAHSNAMSYNLNNGTEKTANGYRINYEDFRVSKGSPNPITSFMFDLDRKNGTFTLSWEYDANIATQYHQDSSSCQIVLYNAEEMLISNVFANESRNILKHKSQSVELSETQHIGTYHIYVYFYKTNGSNECTDSKYLGTFEWQKIQT